MTHNKDELTHGLPGADLENIDTDIRPAFNDRLTEAQRLKVSYEIVTGSKVFSGEFVKKSAGIYAHLIEELEKIKLKPRDENTQAELQVALWAREYLISETSQQLYNRRADLFLHLDTKETLTGRSALDELRAREWLDEKESVFYVLSLAIVPRLETMNLSLGEVVKNLFKRDNLPEINAFAQGVLELAGIDGINNPLDFFREFCFHIGVSQSLEVQDNVELLQDHINYSRRLQAFCYPDDYDDLDGNVAALEFVLDYEHLQIRKSNSQELLLTDLAVGYLTQKLFDSIKES